MCVCVCPFSYNIPFSGSASPLPTKLLASLSVHARWKLLEHLEDALFDTKRGGGVAIGPGMHTHTHTHREREREIVDACALVNGVFASLMPLRVS